MLSRTFFSYVNGLLRIGSRKPLDLQDLWDLARCDEAPTVAARFQAGLTATADELTAPQGRVWRGIVKAHAAKFGLAGVIKLVHDLVVFGGTIPC